MKIANRVLRLRTANGDLEIQINVFAPVQHANGAWFCRYEIGWPDKKTDMSTGGYDAVQALVHALQIIGAEIYSSSYHKAGDLFWDAPGDGYGFPVMSGIRDLLQGNDAKYF